MKKILIVGAGRVGTAMAFDLAVKHEVMLMDIMPSRLQQLDKIIEDHGIKNVELLRLTEFDLVVKSADLVINAVPGHVGYKTLERIILAGKNAVDISFFPEDPFQLDELAQSMKVSVVVDCGVAPGLDNIILGKMCDELIVTDFECLVGGLPEARKFPFEYKAPFSPADVIEEYTRPARLVENGIMVTKDALTECEHTDFDGVGTLEAFNTDGLRTLLTTMPHILNMREKTLRYPGHAAQIKALKAAGFFDKENLENTVKVLFKNWKLETGERELTAFRVTVKGVDESHRDRTVVHEFVDRTDADGTSSMARTTGYTATGMANLILDGLMDRLGIIAPELIGKDKKKYEYIMKHLSDRGVTVNRFEI